MPMPPSQCVRLRHSRKLSGTASMAGVPGPPRIVAPVVVKPDITSKKASVYDASVPDNTQGSAPTSDSRNHASATMAKPSRTRSSPVGRSTTHSAAPPPSAPAATPPNAAHAASPATSA